MNRVALRLAWRELWRRSGRTLLVVLLVAVPVTGLTLLDVRYRTGLESQADWTTRLWGASDATIQSVWGQPWCAPNCVTRDQAEAMLPVGSRVAWSQQGYMPLRADGDDARAAMALVVARSLDEPLLEGTLRLTSGRWPQDDTEMVATADVLAGLGVGTGDPVHLKYQTRTFRVVGVLAGDGTMLAPGFDFGVLRPAVVSWVGYVDLPGDGSTVRLPQELELSMRVALEASPVDGRVLVLGWLGGVLAMAVLGVVVASAFAVSGRRQLVTVGQLSAAGADPATLTRTLALQGTLSGALGAVLGAGAARLVHAGWPWIAVQPGEAEHAVVAWADIAVILVTAVVVATVAAAVPTRALGRVSVMSALAGRRPEQHLTGRHLRAGVLTASGGLLMTSLAVSAGVNGSGTDSAIMVAVGALTTVVGLCVLSPVLVQHISRWFVGAKGAGRLAARGVARHRTRAAAVFTALMIVGAVTCGATVLAERGARSAAPEPDGMRTDLVWLRSWSTEIEPSGEQVTTRIAVPDASGLRDKMAAAVDGDVRWTTAAVAVAQHADGTTAELLVVDDALLQLFGVPAADRAAVLSSPTGLRPTRYPNGFGDDPVREIDVPTMSVEVGALIAHDQAVAAGYTITGEAVWIGVADHPLTYSEAQAVTRITASGVVEKDGPYYLAAGDRWQNVNAELITYPDYPQRTLSLGMTRSLVLGSSLVLILLVVGIGMALWAVEGREERDLLVAVGATPLTLAQVVAWRAGGLTFASMALAVPAGTGAAYLLAHAAGGHIEMPWLMAGALLVPIPLLVGGVAWVCSLLGQRFRPIRASRLAFD